MFFEGFFLCFLKVFFVFFEGFFVFYEGVYTKVFLCFMKGFLCFEFIYPIIKKIKSIKILIFFQILTFYISHSISVQNQKTRQFEELRNKVQLVNRTFLHNFVCHYFRCSNFTLSTDLFWLGLGCVGWRCGCVWGVCGGCVGGVWVLSSNVNN